MHKYCFSMGSNSNNSQNTITIDRSILGPLDKLKTQNVRIFFENFEKRALLEAWSDDYKFNLTKYLGEGAINDAIKARPDIKKYDDLKIYLEEKFVHKQTEYNINTLLINSKQKFDESVQEFASRLQAHGTELLHIRNETSSDRHEKFLLSIFMSGIKYNIKRNLVSHNFKNINEALDAAKKVELFNKEQTDYKNDKNDRNKVNRVKDINIKNTQNNYQKYIDKQNNACFKCHSNSHHYKNCYKLQNNNNNNFHQNNRQFFSNYQSNNRQYGNFSNNYNNSNNYRNFNNNRNFNMNAKFNNNSDNNYRNFNNNNRNFNNGEGFNTNNNSNFNNDYMFRNRNFDNYNKNFNTNYRNYNRNSYNKNYNNFDRNNNFRKNNNYSENNKNKQRNSNSKN